MGRRVPTVLEISSTRSVMLADGLRRVYNELLTFLFFLLFNYCVLKDIYSLYCIKNVYLSRKGINDILHFEQIINI